LWVACVAPPTRVIAPSRPVTPGPAAGGSGERRPVGGARPGAVRRRRRVRGERVEGGSSGVGEHGLATDLGGLQAAATARSPSRAGQLSVCAGPVVTTAISLLTMDLWRALSPQGRALDQLEHEHRPARKPRHAPAAPFATQSATQFDLVLAASCWTSGRPRQRPARAHYGCGSCEEYLRSAIIDEWTQRRSQLEPCSAGHGSELACPRRN
jgi:hypothetical protein